MNKQLEKRLEVAKVVARKAGVFALSLRENNKFEVTEKELNDFVTTADVETEKLIFEEIQKAFPNDGFFGEEGDEIFGEGRWVVDPIDGTTNYFRNLPTWAVSIAYEIEVNQPLIGVIYAPRSNELYYGMKGYGAYLNGKKIQVSTISDISSAINVCVPPHRLKDKYDAYMQNFITIGKASSDLRSYGSSAIELCYIASGHIDGYYELGLGYYDFAAGWIILEEAGGKFSLIDKEAVPSTDKLDIIATNGKIHSWFENTLLRKENEDK